MSAETIPPAERFCSTRSSGVRGDSSQALSARPTLVVSMAGQGRGLPAGEGVAGGHTKVENGEERVEIAGFPEGWWT